MNAPTKRIKWVLSFTFLLMMIVTGVVFAATVTIDEFNGVTQSLSITSGNAFDATDDGATIGGERDFELVWLSGTTVSLRSNSGSPASGFLAFSSETGTQGRATVTFDGDDGDATLVDANGLCAPTCLDLTDGGLNGYLRARVVENDIGTTVHFRLYNGTTGDTNDYIEYALALPGAINPGQAVDFMMPFSSFTSNGAGANPNAVGAIQIFYNRGTPTTAVDVAIDFFDATGLGMEYGDLPDVYGTTLGANGARHQMTSGLRLGANRDSDGDGSPGASANGDDGVSLDDEDGVTRDTTVTGFWTPDNGGTVVVSIAGCVGACRLNGWIDWDDSNDFTGTDEWVIQNQVVSNGSNYYLFPIPVGSGFPATNQTVYARFRVCQATGTTCNSPTGVALNGEVEDYYWAFDPSAISLQTMTTEVSFPSWLLVSVGFLALVSTGVILYRRRQLVR